MLSLLQTSAVANFRIDKVLAHGASGAAYNYAAFINKKSKTGESWNPKKAARPILIGLLAGILTAFIYPDSDIGGTSYEQMLLIAPAILDQLLGASTNISSQIKHSQFSEWGEDWFEDGRTPTSNQPEQSNLSKPSEEDAEKPVDWPNDATPPSSSSESSSSEESHSDPGSMNPDEYFAAVSPDDEER